MIPQEFWHSNFWIKFRKAYPVLVLGLLYRRCLSLRHILLSKIFCPYVALSAKNKHTSSDLYPFGEIFFSLTTYPARIHEVYYTICSLLIQSSPANKIILTLTKEEFPDGESSLPSKILKLKENGLEILWADTNLRPHNKYFHVMKKYPKVTIVTVDDDIIYSKHMLSKLIKSYKQFPRTVIALCTDKFIVKKGNILPYSQSMHCYDSKINEPRMDLCANGYAGVLYPPSILPQETFNVEAIKKCAPIADDIWLKFMELSSDIPVVCAGKYKDPVVMPQIQNTALNKINGEQNKNDYQQLAIIKEYSHIDFVSKIKNSAT